MNARNLNDHLDWCRKMAHSKNFIDLDRDDVLSLSMVAAWQSLDCPQSQQIVPLRNTIFKKDINDLRRHVWARKRSPSRCRHFYQNEDVDGEGFPDRSQDDPLDILIARETVAPLVQFYEEHGYPPAAPCAGCGTLGGLVRSDGTCPRRTDGLCHSCYQRAWNARRRRSGGGS